jgi:hypothetical protein
MYVSRIISRIKKLERDVAIVSGGEMTHTISGNGRDEIAVLSENVEDMRQSIIDKLNKERQIKEANNELVTSISHDLRTPLTVLMGYIDMMKNHKDCNGELKEYVIASENTALRLKRLSDDMFKYSLAFGDQDNGIKLESYDARTLLDQLLSEHMLLLTESGFDVRRKILGKSFDGMTVCTDAPNLMRIIDNIFSNLSKYADREYPIEFTIERNGMAVTFESKNKIRAEATAVESNGIGLKTCTRLSKTISDGFHYEEQNGYFVDQFDNEYNVEFHKRITGPALLQAVGGRLDIAVIGVGSAGTVTGVGEHLKAWAGNVKIVAVEPHECSVLSGGFAGKHQISGLGAGFKPGNYNPYIVDQIVRVPSHEAHRAASQLLLCEGIPAGAASGAVAAAAVQLASQPENAGKRIVALLPTRQEL